MKIRDIMRPEPIMLKAEETIEDAAELFLHYGVDFAPVVDEDGNIEGFVNNRHIYRSISEKKIYQPQ